MDAPIAELLRELRQTSARTASLEDLTARLVAVALFGPRIINRRLAPCYARLQETQRLSRASIISSFFASIRRGSERDGTLGLPAVVAFGNAKFPPSVGGSIPAPTVALKRACVAVFGPKNVFFVNEYRTTKTCADCGENLRDVCDPLRPDAKSNRLRELELRERAAGRAAFAARAAGGGLSRRGTERAPPIGKKFYTAREPPDETRHLPALPFTIRLQLYSR
jgi:hypothetical protein